MEVHHTARHGPRARGVIVHPTGNRNVREVLRACTERDALEAFFTAIDGAALARWIGWCGPAARRECLRRAYPEMDARLIRARPWRELARLGSIRLSGSRLTSRGPFSVDSVYREVDARAARFLRGRATPVHFVYAYEDGALESFRAAQERGIRRIYDLPIAYFKTGYRLMTEEATRYPDWAPTLGIDQDHPEKLERKREELRLAEVVMCASSFVLGSLPFEMQKAKDCRVGLFGCDLEERAQRSAPPANGPLKVLFVGRLTQRKGLADVFTAMRLLGASASVELHLLGPLEAPRTFYESQGVKFIYHPPRAREEVLATMASCHLLVLPSIVEGRALVQLEALAQGTPLLVTRNAGGEDLVEEGRTGWLVPIRSPEMLAERLANCAGDRATVLRMRKACREKAASVKWTTYRKKVLDAVLGSEEA